MALVLAVLCGVVAGVILAALLSPWKRDLELDNWPSVPSLIVQAMRSELLHLVKADPPTALSVRLKRPVSFNATRLQKFMQLCQYEGTAGETPLMYPITESFRLVLQVLLLPSFPFCVVGSVLRSYSGTMYCSVSVSEKLCYSCDMDPAITYSARGHPQVKICVTAKTAAGLLVWRGMLVVIVLKRTKGAADSPGQAAADVAASPPPDLHQVDELLVGGDAGRCYAELNGDYNPIHLHAAVARLWGFKRPIAHALFLVACAEASLRRAGLAPSYPLVLEADFKRPTLLPAKLRLLTSSALISSSLPAAHASPYLSSGWPSKGRRPVEARS